MLRIPSDCNTVFRPLQIKHPRFFPGRFTRDREASISGNFPLKRIKVHDSGTIPLKKIPCTVKCGAL